MMTGTVIGYNRTGSSTSRLRARTSIAANSVPTAANPSVPAASRPRQPAAAARSSGAWNSSADQRHEHELRRAPAAAGCRAACRRRAPADRPAPAAARAASRSGARARRCGPSASVPENAIATHRIAAATSSSGAAFHARGRTRTPGRTDTAKNSVVERISRLRTSTVRSLRTTSQATRKKSLMRRPSPCR